MQHFNATWENWIDAKQIISPVFLILSIGFGQEEETNANTEFSQKYTFKQSNWMEIFHQNLILVA